MMETIFFIAIVVIEIVVHVHEFRRHSYCVVTLNKNVIAEGAERKTSNGYSFCAFTGIPYARPPVGSNRFELPEKIPLWIGRRQYTEGANVCVQMSYETLEVIGSEDCLLLNVYTIINRDKIINKENTRNLLPVLFWLHGGSFNIGSAGSDINRPDYFIEKEIVVVTINYRLGPFGFLSHSNVTANIGLHDQRMALQWVNENILYFGGNRSTITLGGWSSGGASVSYHMYADKSKNLFEKAIMMSGNMLNPWAFEGDVVRCTNELIRKLNIQNCTHVVEELKLVDAYHFIPPLFSDELKILFFGSEQFCFVPTVDDEFVTYPPHIISQHRTPSNVPVLIGTTSLESEWTMSFETSNFQYPNKNLNHSKLVNHLMSQIFEHNYNATALELSIQRFQHISDMSYGVFNFIQNYIDSTEQENVFLYRFAFDDEFGALNENANHADMGAIHGDELKYLFKDIKGADVAQQNTIHLIKQRMVNMWTNFIKFGNPTPTNKDCYSVTTWPPFNIEEKLLLNINYEMTVEKFSHSDAAFQLWDAIYQCLYYVQCDELNEFFINNKSVDF